MQAVVSGEVGPFKTSHFLGRTRCRAWQQMLLTAVRTERENMRMLRGWLLGCALASVGCAESPAAVSEISHVEIILAAADSIQMGDTLKVQTELRSESGGVVPGSVDWTSRDDRVLTVNGSRVQAAGPGFTYLIARSGNAADSIGVTVGTFRCTMLNQVGAGNGFYGTLLAAGSNGYPEGPGAYAIYFRGVPAFFGSGLIYGHHPDSTFVGFGFLGWPRTGLGGRVCRVSLEPGHTLALVDRNRDAPPHPSNLVVSQEHWSFHEEDANDFVLFRFTFTNRGITPIVGLRIGFAADFDVYRPDTNVGRFDPATGIASVVAADSVNEPVTVGMIALGATVVNYFETLSTGPRLTRAAHFDALAPSEVRSVQSVIHDVRQIIAVAPMTLQPGETKSVGYALVGGETSTEFLRNVALARQKASSIWH